MSALDRRAYDEISRSVLALVLDEPFFGHLLSGLNREVTSSTATAAVGVTSGRPTLRINAEFFTKEITRRAERVAVVKHEALHILLGHLFRIDNANQDRFVFNLAADIVVNQFIGSRWSLPESAVTLATFPAYGLEPDQSVEWYYERLIPHIDEIDKRFAASHSDHAHWGSWANSGEGDLARRQAATLVRDARDRSGRWFDDVDPVLQNLVIALIEQLEPTVDWRRVLAMFANSGRRTRLQNTLRRPSKRYGTYPGRKVRREHRLAVAIDTSASVTDADLSAFFGEIFGIWRQGSDITVIEADCIVRRTWKYEGGPPPTEIAGRCGTDYGPVMEWMVECEASGNRFDGLVYLTDGLAPAPKRLPRANILWVTTDEAESAPLEESGRVVQINR